MCINIISTAPWSPWQTRRNSPFTNEEPQPPRLQYVEDVIRLSKLEQRTCLTLPLAGLREQSLKVEERILNRY
jgi:hypothetical protein